MGSYDFADRTLPPTERHRRAAKTRGDVVRSTELTVAVQIFAVCCTIWLIAPASANHLASFVSKSISTQQFDKLDVASTTELMANAFQTIAVIGLPIGLTLLISGLIANLVQIGWLWVPALAFPGFRPRPIFSWHKSLEALGRLLRFFALFVVAYWYLSTRVGRIKSFGLIDPSAMLAQVSAMFGELCVPLATCIFAFAAIDYGIRYWRHEQKLKMTVDERRREQRDDAIDPQIKRRRSASMDDRYLERTASIDGDIV